MHGGALKVPAGLAYEQVPSMPLASCGSVSAWAVQASKVAASGSLMSSLDMSIAIVGEATPQPIVCDYISVAGPPK